MKGNEPNIKVHVSALQVNEAGRISASCSSHPQARIDILTQRAEAALAYTTEEKTKV